MKILLILVFLFLTSTAKITFSQYSSYENSCSSRLNGTLEIEESTCLSNGTHSFLFSCLPATSLITGVVCRGSSCNTGCTNYNYFSNTCIFSNPFFKYEGPISATCNSSPRQVLGGFELSLKPVCSATSPKFSSFFGTGNCQRISSTSSSRTFCKNRNVIQEIYSQSSTCSFTPTRTITLYTSGGCNNGVEIVSCLEEYSEGTWWLVFTFACPLLAILSVTLCFYNKSILFALRDLIRLNFNGCLSNIYLRELLKLNYGKVATFYHASKTRLALAIFYGFLTVEFFILSILLYVWRNSTGVCPSYSFIANPIFFYLLFGYFTYIITISVFLNLIIFCSSFFYSMNQQDSALLHQTGIYNFNSKYYLNWTDYGSLFLSVVFILTSIPSGIFGIILIVNHFTSDIYCNVAPYVPVVGIISLIPWVIDVLLIGHLIAALYPLCKRGNISTTIPTTTPTFVDIPIHEKPDIYRLMIKQWKKEHIHDWLKDNGLGDYYSKLSFVPIEAFPTLEPNDIAQNGIDNPYHQKSILCVAKSLNLLSFYLPDERTPFTWNTEFVQAFLSLQIPNAKETIKKFCLNGPYLCSLTDNEILNILSIDYSSIGQRKIEFYKSAITRDVNFYKYTGFQGWNNDQVLKWLETMGFSQYKKEFKKQRIFGALIPFINSPECFSELGIQESHIQSFKIAIEKISKNEGTTYVKTWIKNIQIDSSLADYVNDNAIHLMFLFSLSVDHVDLMFPPLQSNSLKKKAFLEQLKKLKEEYGYRENEPELIKPSVSSNVPLQEFSLYKPNAPTIDEVDDQNLCKICFDNPKCMLTIPCRHICMCEKCSSKVVECPICRTSIETSMKVFSV